MCGILFSTVSGIDEKKFQIALQRMSYRGPDASGILCHENIKLGHRRLAILDLNDRSNQPLISADQHYAIIFNGEIYNFQALAKKHNLILTTTSDTEVLLALYQLLGPAMLSELNGMFAFVIVDLWNSSWFAARDRLGVKPLYQAQYGDGILLSSEPGPLIELIGSTQFDVIGLRQYRKLRTFFNGRTIWQGVSQFPAGHYLTENKKNICWWKFPSEPQSIPQDDELRDLIKDAVKIREVADVAVGAYLSGGLDSTIVAGIAQQGDTWTVGFDDCNEFEWGRVAAIAFASRHHEILMDYSEFLVLAKKMLIARAEPLSVPNEVLLYKMTLAAAPYNKVILSGEGADELFFGYDRIFRWAATHEWNLAEFAKLYAYGSNDDLAIVEDAVQPFLKYGDALSIVAAFFQVAHLHGLLRRLDSATMLCSVEARVPFVDYRLVERLAGVPFAWRMAKDQVKAPLKRIFSDLVPPGIIQRPKVGFPVPLAQIPFAPNSGKSPMDRWFEFNLSTLMDVPLLMEDVL